MKKQIFISFGIFGFLIIATILVILYGSGYRLNLDGNKPNLSSTGLLDATSTPDGAEVYLDNHLTTVTNNNISLTPRQYTIKISKEGYFSWSKKINIQQGIVSKTEAILFPTYPKLDSLTATGVLEPVLDPSQTKIAYLVASQSAKNKNGIYILDMNGGSLLTLQNSSRQIANDTTDIFSQSQLSWSPDGQSLLATISANRTSPSVYELDANSFNQTPKDVTVTLTDIQTQWQKYKEQRDKVVFSILPKKLVDIVNADFSILKWSPDETKILYTASTSATIPLMINPPHIGANSTPETRTITQNNIYVYDIKEDKNYFIVDPSKSAGSGVIFQWMPDSKHLIAVHNRIDIMEYDGLNNTTVYSYPFIGNSVFPWPNGEKIVILTDLNNPDILPNLYTISLK